MKRCACGCGLPIPATAHGLKKYSQDCPNREVRRHKIKQESAQRRQQGESKLPTQGLIRRRCNNDECRKVYASPVALDGGPQYRFCPTCREAMEELEVGALA